MEVYTMKKYVVSTILALSLVVGLLISAPATMANAKTFNCPEIGTKTVKISIADKGNIADLLGNILGKFNIDKDCINSILDRYMKPGSTAPDNTKPEEEVETPVENPDTEAPAETPETPEETPEAPVENPKEETPEAPTETPQPPVENPSGLSAEQSRMLELVNQERAKAGLHALKWDADLARVADLKAQDMVQNNYFSHTSPTYGSPFDMMRNFGIKYRTAGENLAGYNSVEGAHNGLMNSDGHRANILNSSFTHIGIGVQKSPRYGYVFVQMFIGK